MDALKFLARRSKAPRFEALVILEGSSRIMIPGTGIVRVEPPFGSNEKKNNNEKIENEINISGSYERD